MFTVPEYKLMYTENDSHIMIFFSIRDSMQSIIAYIE
jgi:hypothetical protein